jgi:serine/threonine protein kinase
MIQLHSYNIDREIGHGGMATVYLAKHNLLQEPVAIKVLKRDYAHHENIRSRFLSEARILFRMSHPHIIKVTDMINYGDLPGFVMEYIDGPSLKEYIERKGPLSKEEIQQLFSQVLLAVDYIHKKGFVHRDLKPSNFMIDKDFQLKLLDFGIVKFMDSQSADFTQTHTHQQMGTPMYMSPEQVVETKSVTAASDIYSLGVVLWQMVTGRKPYDAVNLAQYELQSKILNQSLPLTNTPWDIFIQKATRKNAEERYSDCCFF